VLPEDVDLDFESEAVEEAGVVDWVGVACEGSEASSAEASLFAAVPSELSLLLDLLDLAPVAADGSGCVAELLGVVGDFAAFEDCEISCGRRADWSASAKF